MNIQTQINCEFYLNHSDQIHDDVNFLKHERISINIKPIINTSSELMNLTELKRRSVPNMIFISIHIHQFLFNDEFTQKINRIRIKIRIRIRKTIPDEKHNKYSI